MIHWKDLREDLDLHQKDVAKYLGISRSAYSNYENGTRKPDPETLKKLAELFHVSVDELLDYTPENSAEFRLCSKEKELILKYRALSKIGRLRIERQLQFEQELESELL